MTHISWPDQLIQQADTLLEHRAVRAQLMLPAQQQQVLCKLLYLTFRTLSVILLYDGAELGVAFNPLKDEYGY